MKFLHSAFCLVLCVWHVSGEINVVGSLDKFSAELIKTVGKDVESGLKMLVDEGIARVSSLLGLEFED